MVDFNFKHPFTCVVAGPTQSGKTYFIQSLIRCMDTMIRPVPERIIWCCSEKVEESFMSLMDQQILVTDDIDDILENIDRSIRNLVIIDDFMQEAGDAKEIATLFTRGSHHWNTSVIFVVQNLFHQGKVMRSVSLNAHYLIIFKNPRDMAQIGYLARQLFPTKTKYLIDAYNQATRKPHGYLALDLTQDAPEDRRVLSDILPNEEGFYYVPK